MNVENLIKIEREFCDSIDCETNEFGNFIYESQNGISKINLPYILLEYKQMLIDEKDS